LSKKANFAPAQNLLFCRCLEALFPRGFAARRLRRSLSVYQASQADNRFFLTIELDAYGLRCPRPAQAVSKAEPVLY